jgi:hypothetical protein
MPVADVPYGFQITNGYLKQPEEPDSPSSKIAAMFAGPS